jgi:hypothetical protein
VAALTNRQAAQRARDLLTEESEAAAGLSVPTIIGLIPTALETYARRKAASDDYEDLLKEYTGIPIAAGVLDLADLAAALFDPWRAIVYPAADATEPAVPVDGPGALAHGRFEAGDGEAVYFAQAGLKLRFFNPADGELDTLASSDAVVVTNFVPAIGDVPVAEPGAFVLELAETAAGQLLPQQLGQKVAESLRQRRADG